MSSHEKLTPPENLEPEVYATDLRSLLLEIQFQTQEMKVHSEARRRAWDQVADLIRTNGVPEEVKFLVAAFAGDPTDPEANRTYVEYLKRIDERVKESAGHTVAWLTSEEVVTSTSFNPSIAPSTDRRYFFHVGLLPQDARLIVEAHGHLSVPVERAAVVPLSGIYLRDDPLSFESELHPLPTLGDSNPVRLEHNPKIDISRWSKEHPFPLLIGNLAVESVLKGDLNGYPEVEKALDLITSRLF
ncbi:MAG: hypothetical protein AAB896_01055 [Patescibacteria group bacterium]